MVKREFFFHNLEEYLNYKISTMGKYRTAELQQPLTASETFSVC